MTTTPDRCPLCGGMEHDRYRACDNPKCELPAKNWPRVAELVAIRDAVCEWRAMCELDGPGTCQEIWAQESLMTELARQEAER